MAWRWKAVWVLCFWMVGGSVASAQSSTFIPDKIKLKASKKKEGWFPNLDLGFNFAFSQSDGVVGIPDGTSLSFGLQLDAGILLIGGRHEWKNDLKILHTQTKTPTIDQFLKSADAASLDSMYTYKFLRWLGAFVALRAETSLVDGFLVKDADTTLRITRVGGTTPEVKVLPAQSVQPLTRGLSPFFLKPSVGLRLTPYEEKFFKFDVKAGVGMIMAWVQNGLVVSDDAGTPDLELNELQDYMQIGTELKVAIAGGLNLGQLTNSFVYSLSAGAMLPFYSSLNPNNDLLGLLNFDLKLTLGLKINKFLSINYGLNVTRAPLIQEAIQITNTLLISLTLSVL